MSTTGKGPKQTGKNQKGSAKTTAKGNKKPPSATKAEKKQEVSNGTDTTPDFLFTGASPVQLENKWLDKVSRLVKKKQSISEADKFSEHLEKLYDELLKELCTRCGEKYEPLFSQTNGSSTETETRTDASPSTSNINRIKDLEKKLSEKQTALNELSREKDEQSNQDQEKLKKINSEKEQLQSEVNRLSAENSKLKKTVEELQKSVKDENNRAIKAESDLKQKNESSKSDDNDSRIKSLTEMKENLSKEKSHQENQIKELKDRLEESENANNKLKQELEKSRKSKEIEIKNRESVEKKNNELQETLKSLEEKVSSNNKTKVEVEGSNREQITRLTGENQRLKEDEKRLRETLKIKEKELVKSQENINVTKAEKESLQNLLDQIQDQLEKEKNKLKEEKKNSEKAPNQRIKELQEENEKLRDRLSQVAGSKLTDNNPAIADLGDPNRPTQLGEKFSELYDNEWTDAMEELTNAGDEKSNITTLRNIVEKSYEFGKTRAANYVKGLEQALLSISNSIEVTPEISKFIKDHRKNTSLLVIEGLYKAFLSSHTEYNIGGDGVKNFIKKSVSLCWLMAVQDPPVILTTKITGKFDTDRFRHYTKSGSTVDYVVWPIVYLHEGGPIICKGVAQGK